MQTIENNQLMSPRVNLEPDQTDGMLLTLPGKRYSMDF